MSDQNPNPNQTANRPVFHCAAVQTLRGHLLQERFQAIAGTANLPADSMTVVIAYTLADNLAQTREIEFSDHTAPEWDGLRTFWLFVQGTTDYQAIWDRALDVLDLDVLMAWNEVVTEQRRHALHAPDELQPDAPADGALDPNA